MQKHRSLYLYTTLFLIVGLVSLILSSCGNKNEQGATDSSSNALYSEANKPDDTEIVKDVNGNVYHTVKIGTQVWMVENLKATHFRNGDTIPHLSTDDQWSTLLQHAAYCNYDSDSTNAHTYGRLYNWYAVNDNRKLAPEGWHIPTLEEWEILIKNLGGTAITGGKLKESGTAHWDTPNTGASNISGFAALPGGERNNNGTFTNKGFSGGWWTATGSDGDFATTIGLICNSSNISIDIDDMRYGYSVRCIKD